MVYQYEIKWVQLYNSTLVEKVVNFMSRFKGIGAVFSGKEELSTLKDTPSLYLSSHPCELFLGYILY